MKLSLSTGTQVRSEIRSRQAGTAAKTSKAFLPVLAVLVAFALTSSAEKAPADPQVAKLTAVLQSAAPQKEKADACRELARLGNKDAVAALAALLPDAQLSHMARYGLETIPDPAVDAAFREALGHLKGRPLVGVIGSVGVRRDTKATKTLAQFLTDSDPEVAQAAARSLGKIGTPASGKALVKVVSTVPPANQVAFCEGLFRCAQRLSVDGHSKQAIEIYDTVRKLSLPHQARTAALRGSILARGKAGLPLLAESMQSKDYAVFAAATRVSFEMPGEAVTQVLAAELPKNSGDRQILITQALGKRGDPTALPALSAAAKNCEKSVRLAAIRAISELCNPSTVRLFQDLLADQDAEIAAAAKEALGALPGMEADSAVLFMLRSSDPARRDLGLELIGRRRMTSATPDLIKMAKDPQPAVRTAALRRLGELGTSRDLPGLLELLGEANTPQDMEGTEQALQVIAVGSPRTDATMKQLSESFNKAVAPQKCALVRVLAAVGGAASLDCVRAGVKDSSAEVRTASIRALGTWNSSEAAPDLLQLARTAADPAEKLLCLRGYLSLAAQSDLPAEKALAMCNDVAGLVQQPEEKKLLLGALGNIHTAGSVKLIQPYLTDASVKDEAATACVSVSEKLLQAQDAAKNARELIEPLRQVTETNPNTERSRKAQSLLEAAQKKSGQK